jgi:hypothetical protein
MPSIRERLPLADAIREDGRVLRDICDLLRANTAFSEWPVLHLQALRVALHPDTSLRQEQSKAARLERHLFGAVSSPEIESTDVEVGRLADRLRADLADLVPFGAGFYLIDYDEVAAKFLAGVPWRSAR